MQGWKAAIGVMMSNTKALSLQPYSHTKVCQPCYSCSGGDMHPTPMRGCRRTSRSRKNLEHSYVFIAFLTMWFSWSWKPVFCKELSNSSQVNQVKNSKNAMGACLRVQLVKRGNESLDNEFCYGTGNHGNLNQNLGFPVDTCRLEEQQTVARARAGARNRADSCNCQSLFTGLIEDP